jgi:hypothetical protein
VIRDRVTLRGDDRPDLLVYRIPDGAETDPIENVQETLHGFRGLVMNEDFAAVLSDFRSPWKFPEEAPDVV